MSSDDEGWQVIEPKGRNGHRKLAALIAREAVHTQTGAGLSSSQPTPVLDVAIIAADHEKLCKQWRDSAGHATLRSLVSDNAAAHATVKTAVCLGTGSFDVGKHSSRHGRAMHDAHVQLEAFLVVVGVLEKHTGQPIKCYVQEPAFGPSDEAYCTSLGIEVVDTPDAFRHVGPDSFVFGVHLPHPVWGYVLSEHIPALCIGMHLRSLEQLSTAFRDDPALETVLSRLREIHSTHDRFAFPTAEPGTRLECTFASTDILWLSKGVDPVAA